MQLNGKNRISKLEYRGAKNGRSGDLAPSDRAPPKGLGSLAAFPAKLVPSKALQRRKAASPLFATVGSSCTITDDTRISALSLLTRALTRTRWPAFSFKKSGLITL
jgi:hypothetical protein